MQRLGEEHVFSFIRCLVHEDWRISRDGYPPVRGGQPCGRSHSGQQEQHHHCHARGRERPVGQVNAFWRTEHVIVAASGELSGVQSRIQCIRA